MSRNSPPITPSYLRCLRCGYDLTGATVGGVCSECGLPVGESLKRRDGTQSCGQATASMIVGILSLTVCGLLGPVAIMLYYGAMAQINSGGYAASSRSMAKAGLILGIIATALMVLVVAFFAMVSMM